MQLTYNNQTINFFDKVPDKILLSLSGGCDSASILYLICKHFPKMEVIPFNCLDIHHPFDTQCARDVLSWIKTNFPNQKIKDLETYEFDDLDPNYEEDAKKYMKDNPYMFRRVRGVVKVMKMREIHLKLNKKYLNAMIVSGQSKNPSIEDMKKYPNNILLDKREHRRDKFSVQLKSTRHYQPYANVDKKFVADIFKKNNLMNSLFKLTGSCVGSFKQTKGFTEPCKTCWWCHEKNWAFGEF